VLGVWLRFAGGSRARGRAGSLGEAYVDTARSPGYEVLRPA